MTNRIARRGKPALALGTAAASAQSPLGMGYVDAPDVRLIHPRHGLSYLVPHALGTFQQALAAQRRIFGSAQPAFATAAARRLACLVLRPGVLTVSAWDAELAWPLASVDLALRRAGWDQDPGWLPWLGRSLRWRFGDAS